MVRRLGGLALGPVGGRRRRRHRRRARRPAARPWPRSRSASTTSSPASPSTSRPRRRAGSCRARSSSATSDGTITQSPTHVGHHRHASRCRSSPAAASSAGRRRTRSAGSTSSAGSSSPTSPACCRGFTTEPGLLRRSSPWLLIPISAYLLWRTPFGLRLRSIGEKPVAADSLGVPVYRIRYIGVTISGALAGLGGAWLAIDVRAYNQDQIAGRGFQGLAALIFGNWRPAGLAAGAGAVRVRPVADAADRHRAGAGAVPPGRPRLRRAGRLPDRQAPASRRPSARWSWAAWRSSTTSITEDGEQPDRLHHAVPRHADRPGLRLAAPAPAGGRRASRGARAHGVTVDCRTSTGTRCGTRRWRRPSTRTCRTRSSTWAPPA